MARHEVEMMGDRLVGMENNGMIDQAADNDYRAIHQSI
jgi:hypothetical protein